MGNHQDPFVRKLNCCFFFPWKYTPSLCKDGEGKGTTSVYQIPHDNIFDLMFLKSHVVLSWLAQAQKQACMLSGFQTLCYTYTNHQSVKRSIVISTDWVHGSFPNPASKGHPGLFICGLLITGQAPRNILSILFFALGFRKAKKLI